MFLPAVHEVLISLHPHLWSIFLINVHLVCRGGNAGLTGAFKRRFCIFCPAFCCSSRGDGSGSWITKQPEMQGSLSPVAPPPPPASPQTLFLCPCSKSLSTQQPPSKTLIQSCPSQYRPVRGSYSLIQSTLLTSVTIPDPLCSREPPLWVFFLSLPCPASQAYSSQVTWRIPSLPNSSLLSL